MRRSLSTICLALLLFGSFVYSLEHPDKRAIPPCTYSYDPEAADGPEHWSEVCTNSDLCNHGLKQSPIDIVTDSSFEHTVTALNASYTELEGVTLQNMGHTLQIFNTNNKVGIQGGPLPAFYQLIQAHFHAPSEHTFNGAHYPFELHLVHSYNNGAKLAVLGFFFQHSIYPNDFLAQFQPHLDEIPKQNNQTTVDAHLELLLKSVSGYYHYQGSLTTPPCSEIVDWLFSTTVLKATPEQIEAFAEMMHHNSRPVQPINTRILYQYSAGNNADVAAPRTNTGNVFNFNFANMMGGSH